MLLFRRAMRSSSRWFGSGAYAASIMIFLMGLAFVIAGLRAVWLKCSKAPGDNRSIGRFNNERLE